MPDEIYVDLNATNANVIMVDGICYQRVGSSNQPASPTAIQAEFDECSDCGSICYTIWECLYDCLSGTWGTPILTAYGCGEFTLGWSSDPSTTNAAIGYFANSGGTCPECNQNASSITPPSAPTFTPSCSCSKCNDASTISSNGLCVSGHVYTPASGPGCDYWDMTVEQWCVRVDGSGNVFDYNYFLNQATHSVARMSLNTAGAGFTEVDVDVTRFFQLNFAGPTEASANPPIFNTPSAYAGSLAAKLLWSGTAWLFDPTSGGPGPNTTVRTPMAGTFPTTPTVLANSLTGGYHSLDDSGLQLIVGGPYDGQHYRAYVEVTILPSYFCCNNSGTCQSGTLNSTGGCE